MSISSLNLPVDIPWKVLAVSPDMMDVQFGNKKFPFAWRSSLAISAFEPKLTDLPELICDQKLTYFKVTCSITGYQPTKDEIDAGHVIFPNIPTEELDRILSEYFACYGVVLNVAVFPFGKIQNHKQIKIDFGAKIVGNTLPNPYAEQGASFERLPQSTHNPDLIIVDLYPANGDGKGELNLENWMEITFPASVRVEAKFTHDNANGVLVRVSRGTEVLEAKAFREQKILLNFAFEKDSIDKVEFLHDGSGKASLMEFSYFILEEAEVTLDEYPHVIDFEPKVRDLYQASSETGEVLTASVSSVNTGKSLTNTESTETGVNLGAKAKAKESELSAELTKKWGETSGDTSTVQTDASRDRRERHGATTNISQMYNLLTGYHVGTNRALFLMLPRPHMLQPTDRRTFVQGLRAIEGIQEFFIVVSRPSGLEALRIESYLETGHFPEKVQKEEPEPEYDESEEDFRVQTYQPPASWYDPSDNCGSFRQIHSVSAGWVVDKRPKRQPDAGHLGIKETGDHSNQQAKNTLRGYNYQAISDATVEVSGGMCGASMAGAGAVFARDYKVFIRSENPKPKDPAAIVTKFLITSRGLWAAMKSTDKCPMVLPISSMTNADTLDIEVAKIIPGASSNRTESINYVYSVPSGWEIDPDSGDTNHPGITFYEDSSNDQAKNSLSDYRCKAITLTSIKVSGKITADISPAIFRRKYKIHIRKQDALSNKASNVFQKRAVESIVDERDIDVGKDIRNPSVKEALRQIQKAMVTSGKGPSRTGIGDITFLESDYFKESIKRSLPKTTLAATIGDIKGLPNAIIETFGKKATIEQLLEIGLNSFCMRAGISHQQAIESRQRLIAYKKES